MKKTVSIGLMIPLQNGKWGHIDKNGRTTAHLAAQYGELDALDFLRVYRPKMLGMANKIGITPAHVAAANGQLDVLVYFKCVDNELLMAITKEGWGIAHFAAHFDQHTIIDYLQQSKFDCDREDHHHVSPMMVAHQNKHYHMVSKLMAHSKVSLCAIL